LKKKKTKLLLREAKVQKLLKTIFKLILAQNMIARPIFLVRKKQIKNILAKISNLIEIS
jgi:hypothetical protein